jgi:death-on-curing protein
VTVDYLDLDDLLAAATAAIGRTPDVRDYGLLESALARPKASVFGTDAYLALTGKAAALMHSIVNSHPLVDGNKRLGWFAANLFLGLNGVELNASEDASYDLVTAVASGRMDDVGKIAEAFDVCSRPA